MKPLCSLNGAILPLAEARIDPQDRGFLFGDALYEVVKVLAGVILHFEPHLERLRSGLRRIAIPIPADLELWCRQLVAACELEDGLLYLQVTRGVASRAHLPPPDLEPTVFALPSSRGFDPPAGRALRAVTVPDCRWQFCDLKTTSMMATVTGKLAVRDKGVDEVLFVGPDRTLREGGSTTLFVRRDKSWQTHPTDGSILEGVTRGILLRLAGALALEVEEIAPRLDDLETWSEAFLCGTMTGVQPLVELDARPIADGRAGPQTRRFAAALADYEAELVSGAATSETSGAE